MYANFAYIYDRLMQDIPYDKWIDYIKKIIAIKDIQPQKVLDLGCGTGNVTLPMVRLGYQMTALDLSPDMLAVAESKAREEGLQISFVNQDMREVNIPEKFDLVLSMCDSMNYLTEEEDLKKVFGKVNNLLREKGLFIFDLNSYYKISSIFGDNTFVLKEDDVAYIWENNFEPLTKTCEMDVTFFVHQSDNSYSRFQEIHQERAYVPEKVEGYLKEAGFRDIKYYEALTFKEPAPTTERIYFIATK